MRAAQSRRVAPPSSVAYAATCQYRGENNFTTPLCPRRREIDKNVDSLINDFEVPRATSAPPHLQEARYGGPQVVSSAVLSIQVSTFQKPLSKLVVPHNNRVKQPDCRSMRYI